MTISPTEPPTVGSDRTEPADAGPRAAAAGPPTVLRSSNFFRRHKMVTSIAFVVILVIVLVVSGAYFFGRQGSPRSFGERSTSAKAGVVAAAVE